MEEEIVGDEAVRVVVGIRWVTNFSSEFKFYVSNLPGGNSCSCRESIIRGILIFLEKMEN